MSNTPVKVPKLGESITEALVASWLKNEGDRVEVDEPLVELETDKITLEVPAPVAGVLVRHGAEVGATVEIDDVIGEIAEGASASKSPETKAEPEPEAKNNAQASESPAAMPAAAAEAKRTGVDLAKVEGTGRGGRILKEDVQKAAKSAPSKPAPKKSAPKSAPAKATPSGNGERVVAMSPLRRRIAQRLVEAQQNAAILTTFNEVDMTEVFRLRKQFKQSFIDTHGVKLGFMSFFLKASVAALKAFPGVNAEIRGTDIVYKDRYDIGVAVGGGKGLVVPVVRSADTLGFADIENEIARLADRARRNKLTLDELTGGTFTISNGGIYGSMLSTPILNPPQSGILGLHNIVQRPVAVDGKVEIRPIMYLALSYDHRLVDGREAVQFLIKIKSCIENPERIMFEI
ncbi:MAG: 2-oxoglutarate dehydrogenase complex dihydrolipoyllysine-residue succinyltransferase [Nannocystaceae bacterium]